MTLERFKYISGIFNDMTSTKIRLMRHHLGSMVKTRLPKQGFLTRVINIAYRQLIFDPLYGNALYNSVISRILSLDPQTRVELVDDRQTDGRLNIDFICESGCPYIPYCSSGKSPASAKRKRAGYAYRLSRMLAMNDGQSQTREELKTLFPSGEYTLSDLVEKSRQYFER